MEHLPINLEDKLNLFTEYWSPKIIAKMNNYHFKLTKIKGEFVWHNHTSTDETFLVLDGKLTIEFRDGKVELQKGEMYVVPKGVEHKPSSENECRVLLIEPAGTINTGNAGGELTAKDNVWI